MLTERVEVIVPTLQKNYDPIDPIKREAAVLSIKYIMSNVAGGYTVLHTSGGWFLEDGTLQEETSSLVYCYTDPETLPDLMEHIKTWADDTRDLLNQEAISITTPQGMQFI